jgi:lysophospholipase L1-like esterase
LLQPAVLAFTQGIFDPQALRRMARKRRHEAPVFFGILARRGRNLARREACARHAIALAPDYHYLRIILAQILGQSGQLAAARAEFDHASQLIPDHAPTLDNLAQLFIDTHHLERAADILRSLTVRFPQTPLYAFRLARLEERLAGERRRLPMPPVRGAPATRWLAYLRRPPPAIAENDREPAGSWETTIPVPPPFPASQQRHDNLLRRLPLRRLHLLLVGDSLMHFWPQSCWRGLRVFNFGIAGNKTQHVLWRLRQLPPHRVDPATAVVMIGTNNLAAGDSAEAIAAGVQAVVRELRRVVSGAEILVLGVPPSGADFAFNRETRLAANAMLRADPALRYLDLDEIITTGFAPDCRNYEPDGIHFSAEGYRVLTRFLISTLG